MWSQAQIMLFSDMKQEFQVVTHHDPNVFLLKDCYDRCWPLLLIIQRDSLLSRIQLFVIESKLYRLFSYDLWISGALPWPYKLPNPQPKILIAPIFWLHRNHKYSFSKKKIYIESTSISITDFAVYLGSVPKHTPG